MASLGLNVYQVIQNELISREGTRSTIGLGFRLAVVEERIRNAEACARNGQIWRLNHAMHPISAVTPRSRLRLERQREKLLSRRGADKDKDDKDPSKMPRDEEIWEVHRHFPKTIFDFKQLQFKPDWVRSLIEFYDVDIFRPDMKRLALDDHCHDIRMNMELCLEELAVAWGLNWFRMGGMSMPTPTPNGHVPPTSHPGSTSSSPASFNRGPSSA